MNRQSKIESIAVKLKHNIEVRESLREILSEKFNKGEQNSTAYKKYQSQFDRADRNEMNLRWELGEMDARLTKAGVLEIY